jgi:hypothetical protein
MEGDEKDERPVVVSKLREARPTVPWENSCDLPALVSAYVATPDQVLRVRLDME